MNVKKNVRIKKLQMRNREALVFDKFEVLQTLTQR